MFFKFFPIHAIPPEVLNRQVRKIIRHRLRNVSSKRRRQLKMLDLGMPL